MAIAAARRADLPLVLAGPISDTAYFKRAIAPSLGDQVRYAGHLIHDELARLVGRSAAVLVTPVWHEPYGLVVAEAMSCGTPVVAFARGGIPEIVSPQGGRLVPPNDVEAMADEIPAALSLARIDVHRHAVACCSAEAMVTAYLHLYRTMIDDRNEKPRDRLLRPPPWLRSPQSALSICAQRRHPVVALTSLDIPRPHPFATVLALPRDDAGARPAEPSANGALHWVPHHDDGLMTRMALITRWIEVTRPAAVVVDVSVEVALFVRLLGVPVIVMAMPGERTDGPHALVHQIADHIVAAWPQELYEPEWLRAYAAKTSYVGGISRFGDRDGLQPTEDRATVLVLSGTGGVDFDQTTVDATAALIPEITWKTLGLRGGPRIPDPWPDICAADVVITHAGQSSVADVAAARRPAIVLPQPRPFDEQHATAETLRRHRLAVATRGWPDARAWRCFIGQARASDSSRWEQWQTTGAAARAAEAIETTVCQYATPGMP